MQTHSGMEVDDIKKVVVSNTVTLPQPALNEPPYCYRSIVQDVKVLANNHGLNSTNNDLCELWYHVHPLISQSKAKDLYRFAFLTIALDEIFPLNSIHYISKGEAVGITWLYYCINRLLVNPSLSHDAKMAVIKAGDVSLKLALAELKDHRLFPPECDEMGNKNQFVALLNHLNIKNSLVVFTNQYYPQRYELFADILHKKSQYVQELKAALVSDQRHSCFFSGSFTIRDKVETNFMRIAASYFLLSQLNINDDLNPVKLRDEVIDYFGEDVLNGRRLGCLSKSHIAKVLDTLIHASTIHPHEVKKVTSYPELKA